MGGLLAKEEEQKMEISDAHRRRVRKIFDKLDKDGNGMLTLNEFAPKMKVRIAKQLG